MTPLSHRLFTVAPALIAALLIMLSAAPMAWSGISLVPNVAWLATIAFARMSYISWPAWLAFLFGLLQDVVFATPLGAQATITLLLLIAIRARPIRVGAPLLRDAWLEAAVLLVAAQVLLVVILQWVLPTPPALIPALLAAPVNILWFPLAYWGTGKLALAMPK